ncbi:zf-HC2 domain-containing protein [Angustibacter sp. Root456]|uniref:zf-HC2 domain-containing protein n=1 Tax=Angustibacter sp. Root456 TaxID=1736539 RepID=UPI0006FABCC6|nr:zf-HC2 domain-containing protein [Angustibacter sp. Root456]KQX65630.1 hypothetical protein ASD06_08305 [Angustibacter sp. Root456]
MISRSTSTPCLGERVSALADGSLRDDVRDRALAHTLTCRACRDALDVERLTIERLHSLPQPQPSAGLMAALYSLGEPGDPVPPRFGPGPGMPRPTPVPLVPPTYPPPTYPPRAGSPGTGPTARPGGSRRPAGVGARARRTRTFVVAAGALGMGFVAAGVLTAGASSSGPTTRTPVAQLTVQPSPRLQPGGGFAGGSVLNAGFVPVMPSARTGGGWGTAADRFDAPAARGVVAHQAVVALAGH